MNPDDICANPECRHRRSVHCDLQTTDTRCRVNAWSHPSVPSCKCTAFREAKPQPESEVKLCPEIIDAQIAEERMELIPDGVPGSNAAPENVQPDSGSGKLQFVSTEMCLTLSSEQFHAYFTICAAHMKDPPEMNGACLVCSWLEQTAHIATLERELEAMTASRDEQVKKTDYAREVRRNQEAMFKDAIRKRDAELEKTKARLAEVERGTG